MDLSSSPAYHPGWSVLNRPENQLSKRLFVKAYLIENGEKFYALLNLFKPPSINLESGIVLKNTMF
ncbi:MAG: hypothetical protein HY785_21165 [Oscillatoriophycideae cyanobacterium NC_groundwater_1537_Pr4_S-0.65um_50_18]|nr:hypothetical protein [Oscillatoriophycideae cyanobacterium NC_groundwater_1537_Pr4_S-0.65um_50_18]